jgi:serine/threonine protein kinase
MTRDSSDDRGRDVGGSGSSAAKDDTVPNNVRRVLAGPPGLASRRRAEPSGDSWDVRACGTRPGDDDSILHGARPVLAGPPEPALARPTVLNERMPRLSGDRYELLRRLGSGGMADVYLACDVVLEREVAIKVLRNSVDNRDLVQRFHREAVALAALRSEHVVSVLDVDVRGDLAYLVMEYLPGRSLSQLVTAEGPLTVARAIRILAQVLDGLEYLHRHNFVHRDVKPANILIDDNDRAVLVDLGIVFDQRRPGLTPANFVAGTPSYLAPEQRARTAVDCRIDLYQAGLVALFALTGTDPSVLGQPMDLAALGSALSSVEAPVAAVVRRALSVDAAERYPSAHDMKAALAAARSAPVRRPAPARRPAARRKGLLAAVAVLLTLAGAALHMAY